MAIIRAETNKKNLLNIYSKFGKRKEFYQYDTNQRLVITCDNLNVDEGKVEFDNAEITEPIAHKIYEHNGKMVCDVPDELLEKNEQFTVYLSVSDEYGSKTICEKTFSVKARDKPADYVTVTTREAYQNGRSDEKSDFWDTYQDYGNRTDYKGAFSGVGWTDEVYNPKYPMVVLDDGNMFAYNDKITDTKVTIDLTNNNNNNNNNTFAYCRALKTIAKLIVGQKTTAFGMFEGCGALTTINLEGEIWTQIIMQESELLDDNTIQQFVYCAKDFSEDETLSEYMYLFEMRFAGDIVARLWDITADERFPEKYRTMSLGEVLDTKGWIS